MPSPDIPLEPTFPQSLLLLVGRMDGKLDQLLLQDKKQDARLDSVEGRVTVLENWRSRALGAIAVVSATAAAAAGGLWVVVAHLWK